MDIYTSANRLEEKIGKIDELLAIILDKIKQESFKDCPSFPSAKIEELNSQLTDASDLITSSMDLIPEDIDMYINKLQNNIDIQHRRIAEIGDRTHEDIVSEIDEMTSEIEVMTEERHLVDLLEDIERSKMKAKQQSEIINQKKMELLELTNQLCACSQTRQELQAKRDDPEMQQRSRHTQRIIDARERCIELANRIYVLRSRLNETALNKVTMD